MQPTIRGQSKCFNFTFGTLSCCPMYLYIQSVMYKCNLLRLSLTKVMRGCSGLTTRGLVHYKLGSRQSRGFGILTLESLECALTGLV